MTNLVNSDVEEIKKKRITKRVLTAADGVSISIDGDSYDRVKQINTQGAGTLTINNPTGTPKDFDSLIITISATAAQTLSFGNKYSATTDIALPTTCGAGKKIKCGFEYSATDDKYYIIAFVNIV